MILTYKVRKYQNTTPPLLGKCAVIIGISKDLEEKIEGSDAIHERTSDFFFASFRARERYIYIFFNQPDQYNNK